MFNTILKTSIITSILITIGCNKRIYNDETTLESDTKVNKQCGWIVSMPPTSEYSGMGDSWMQDKDGKWMITKVGSFSLQDQSIENMPNFSKDDPIYFIKTSETKQYMNDAAHTPYTVKNGRGCACINGNFDKNTMRLLKVNDSEILPVSECEKNKDLKP